MPGSRPPRTYIRKVIDTVHDLPNVLYEVANESSGRVRIRCVRRIGMETPIGDSTQWQYWVINSVKDYEREMGYDPHPIGMTYLFPVDDLSKANEPLWNSPADWISPGFDTFDQSRWLIDPPANNGSKVVLLDTDHFSPFSSTAVWVWKSFLRGYNPILYDLGILSGGVPIIRPNRTHPSTPWSRRDMPWRRPWLRGADQADHDAAASGRRRKRDLRWRTQATRT